MANERMTGVVQRVVADKGFGFISGEDQESYFFHRSEVSDPTAFGPQMVGRTVSFAPVEGPKGLRASAVRV